MSSHLSSIERLSASSNARISSPSVPAEDVSITEQKFDQEDYRTFVIERRLPAKEQKEKALVRWLVQRKIAENSFD